MSPLTVGDWPSLLEERAEHIRNVRSIAVATRIPVVVQGLDELVILYGDMASRTSDEGAWSMPRRSDPQRDLITRLEQKAGSFLLEAGVANDAARAEQLRSLSAIFGAEAQRLQANAA
jgi:hypothetical protein